VRWSLDLSSTRVEKEEDFRKQGYFKLMLFFYISQVFLNKRTYVRSLYTSLARLAYIPAGLFKGSSRFNIINVTDIETSKITCLRINNYTHVYRKHAKKPCLFVWKKKSNQEKIKITLAAATAAKGPQRIGARERFRTFRNTQTLLIQPR